MAEEKSNYEKLQECSQQVSELIELEKLHRVGKVPVDDEQLAIPTEMLTSLRQRFIATRHKLLLNLNTLQQ